MTKKNADIAKKEHHHAEITSTVYRISNSVISEFSYETHAMLNSGCRFI